MRKLITFMFTGFTLAGLSVVLAYLSQPLLYAEEKPVTADQSEYTTTRSELSTNSRCRDTVTTMDISTGPVVNWQAYTDPDHGFKFEYPAEWKLETSIQQSKPYDFPEAIIKRLSTWGDGGAIDLDVWLANEFDLKEWLEWHSILTGAKLPSAKDNAIVAGQPAVVFLERQVTVDMLTTILSDGKYVYRFWHTVTQSPKGVDAYWHMLESFNISTDSCTAIDIPNDMKRSVDDAIQNSGV